MLWADQTRHIFMIFILSTSATLSGDSLMVSLYMENEILLQSFWEYKW